MRETERQTETQAEGCVSMQGAWCGTQSWDPESRPGLKAGTKPLSHPGIPSWCLSDKHTDTTKEIKGKQCK